MSLEQEIFETRVRRTKELADAGHLPYGKRFDFSHQLNEVHELFGAKTAEDLDATHIPVKVCGRIQSLRGKGKAGFLHLSQGGAKLQVYLKVDKLSEQDFKLYQMLDIGDFLGVEGRLFHTRTGELTVEAAKLESGSGDRV